MVSWDALKPWSSNDILNPSAKLLKDLSNILITISANDLHTNNPRKDFSWIRDSWLITSRITSLISLACRKRAQWSIWRRNVFQHCIKCTKRSAKAMFPKWLRCYSELPSQKVSRIWKYSPAPTRSSCLHQWSQTKATREHRFKKTKILYLNLG